MNAISRGFADTAHGQVHFRIAGVAEDAGNALPLVMFHASPGSARSLEPLIGALSTERMVVAFDTLGNGDSDAPKAIEPDIPFFAGAQVAAIDALGISRFDLYGTHTGASIAIEVCHKSPERVRGLILDGVSLYSGADQQKLISRQAPELSAQADGSQFLKAWQMVRDSYVFWPWWDRRAECRRDMDLPAEHRLHEEAVELLKSISSYHMSFRAAFRYDKRPAMRAIKKPTLVCCAQNDVLKPYLDEAAQLVPGTIAKAVTPGTADKASLQETTEIFSEFLRNLI